MSSDGLGGSTAPPLGAEDTSFSEVLLTTEAIMKECVAQGFYRNPICNEKLYLHHKGFTRIAPTAFEPYTDVKVLWLESNGLAVLPCGAPLIQVQPPKPSRLSISVSDSDEGEEEELEEEGGEECMAHTEGGTRDASSVVGVLQERDTPPQVPTRCHADPAAPLLEKPPRRYLPARRLPLCTAVPVTQRDAFSSLYPTVRQLYLHNNVFREMPDLSRFERLDAVSLANNFFSAVRSWCPSWDAAMRAHREKAAADVDEESPLGSTAGQDDRDAALERHRRAAEIYSTFCPHVAICLLEDEGRLPLHDPPLSQRNPCSSLRTLNLANNHLESFDDVAPLLCLKCLSQLDLSLNRLHDGEALLLILERLPQLRSLKLTGNPLVRWLPRYRKTVIARCRHLLYLDDRPVFEEERRLVDAWAAGGDDAEAQERVALKREGEARQEKRMADFRALVAQHRAGGSQEAFCSAVGVAERQSRSGSCSSSTSSDSVDTDVQVV